MDLEQLSAVIEAPSIVVVHQMHVAKILVRISNQRLMPLLDGDTDFLLFVLLVCIDAHVDDVFVGRLLLLVFAEVVQRLVLLQDLNDLLLLGLCA